MYSTGEICAHCRYTLRALPAEGRCPECGTPYDANSLVIGGTRAAKSAARLRIGIALNYLAGIAGILAIVNDAWQMQLNAKTPVLAATVAFCVINANRMSKV